MVPGWNMLQNRLVEPSALTPWPWPEMPQESSAEIVVNTLPADRARQTIHHHPHYYRIRNHLVDFLVHRSKLLQEGRGEEGANDDLPRKVCPGLEDGIALVAGRDAPRAQAPQPAGRTA